MDFISVSDQLWRGPQPTAEDLSELQDHGLSVVVNLREESEASEELCQDLGLTYYHFPVEDWTAPTPKQVEDFLALLESHSEDCFLVHCGAGVGRTAVMVCCYRIRMGWMTPEEALEATEEECPGRPLADVQREFILEFAERGDEPDY